MAQNGSHSGSWVGIELQWSLSEVYELILTDWGLNFARLFTTFWYVISKKKRQKSCFLKSERNVKYVFSNIGQGLPVVKWLQLQKCLAVTLQHFLHVRILTISGVTCSVISPLARSTPRRAGPERRRSAELPESAAAARRDRLRALLYTSDRKWKTDLRKMQLPLSLPTVTALCYKLDCSENSYEMLETHCVKNILRSSWFGACSPSQCTGARSSQKLWNPYQRWNCLN